MMNSHKRYRRYIPAVPAALLILFCFSLPGFAQQITHEVERGETLFSIARQYDVTVQELRTWNNLQSNELSPGQTLVTGRGPAEEPAADSLIHTVQKQETLFSISKKYGVSITELKSWNDLENDNLNIGQELTVYPSGPGEQGEKSIVEDDVRVQNNEYYIVKSGDSLYRIAGEHGMTVDELKELNGLATNNISVGQRLTVREASSPPSIAENASSSPQGKFISYRITEEDENLQQILRKFEMDESEFSALNPSVDPESIQKGQRLTVLAPPGRTYENPYQTDASLRDLGSTRVSRYSASEKGNPTTNGELYNPGALTAAHPNISLGTVVFIQNPESGRGVYIRINDRISGSGMKLSETAWKTLQFSSAANPTVNIYQD